MLKEPLSPEEARRLIRSILAGGNVVFSRHAEEEMAQDGIKSVDVVNVLRGGVVQPPNPERGTWRYQVRTARITVVVAFRSEQELVVVTAWRNRR